MTLRISNDMLPSANVSVQQATPSLQIERELVLTIVNASVQTKLDYFNAHADDVLEAATMIETALRNSKKVLLCGNGGSSTDAQHIAGEFVNRFALESRRALPA